MKNDFKVESHYYKNVKGKWNFRIMIFVGNFKPKFLSGSNQGFENKKECVDVASGWTYKGKKAKAIEVNYKRLF